MEEYKAPIMANPTPTGTVVDIAHCEKGGTHKSTGTSIKVDIMRSMTGHRVGFIDGDEGNHSTYDRFASKDEDGRIIDAADEMEELVNGAWLVNLRSPNGRAKLLEAIEYGNLDYLLADGPGGADSNFGDIFGEGFKPSDFVDSLKEVNAELVFNVPLVAGNKKAVESIANLRETFRGVDGVRYVATMSGWGNPISDNVVDPRFSLWLNSKTRKSMIDDGVLAELRINEINEQIMAKFDQAPFPISILITPGIDKRYGIGIRERQALRTMRDNVFEQMKSDPSLKALYRL